MLHTKNQSFSLIPSKRKTRDLNKAVSENKDASEKIALKHETNYSKLGTNQMEILDREKEKTTIFFPKKGIAITLEIASGEKKLSLTIITPEKSESIKIGYKEAMEIFEIFTIKIGTLVEVTLGEELRKKVNNCNTSNLRKQRGNTKEVKEVDNCQK